VPRPSVKLRANICTMRQQRFPMTHSSSGSLRSLSPGKRSKKRAKSLASGLALVQIPTLTSEAAPSVQATLPATAPGESGQRSVHALQSACIRQMSSLICSIVPLKITRLSPSGFSVISRLPRTTITRDAGSRPASFAICFTAANRFDTIAEAAKFADHCFVTIRAGRSLSERWFVRSSAASLFPKGHASASSEYSVKTTQDYQASKLV
jgi:hypothetical protein